LLGDESHVVLLLIAGGGGLELMGLLKLNFTKKIFSFGFVFF
jgi:hypothetical protein